MIYIMILLNHAQIVHEKGDGFMLWTKENHDVWMADVVFVNNLKFEAGNLNFRFVSEYIKLLML